MKRFIWELAREYIKLKGPNQLPSTSWRSRKADNVIQSKSKGLRTMGVGAVNGIPPSPSTDAFRAKRLSLA